MAWREAFGRFRVELLLFAGALVVYAIFSGGLLAHQSLAPHFVWQADAFLHGHLEVHKPPNGNDWVLQDGRWYVSFPPFPAVLMMPFVAIAGLSFNDVAFTLVVAALNVALFYNLLRRLHLWPLLDGEPRGGAGFAGDGRSAKARSIGEWQDAALALLFGFGTLAFCCSIRGEVWFTAEVIGVMLTLLYLHFSLGAAKPFLAGLAVACAAVTRTPLAFSAVFFLFEAVRTSRPVLLKKLLPFFAAIVLVAIPVAAMNYSRFGSITEFGHSHLYNNRVNAQVARFGLFHYAFLERNLHDAFTRLPEIQFHPLRIGFNGEGMSLFVTTPLFFYLLWPRRRDVLQRELWLTTAVIALPGFFYQNSGYFQFGFRFSLDYTPYLFLLLALGAHRFTRLFWGVALAGVAVNTWGALVFNRLY